MQEFETDWKDYQLPSGQKFSIGICGYEKHVRYFCFGIDPLKKIFGQSITIDDNNVCSKAKMCMAFDCPYNKSTNADIAHMLDIDETDEVDEDTAKQWGSNTLVGCYIEMAKSMTNELRNQK